MRIIRLTPRVDPQPKPPDTHVPHRASSSSLLVVGGHENEIDVGTPVFRTPTPVARVPPPVLQPLTARGSPASGASGSRPPISKDGEDMSASHPQSLPHAGYGDSDHLAALLAFLHTEVDGKNKGNHGSAEVSGPHLLPVSHASAAVNFPPARVPSGNNPIHADINANEDPKLRVIRHKPPVAPTSSPNTRHPERSPASPVGPHLHFALPSSQAVPIAVLHNHPIPPAPVLTPSRPRDPGGGAYPVGSASASAPDSAPPLAPVRSSGSPGPPPLRPITQQRVAPVPVVSIALLRPIPTVATPSPHPAAPDNSMNTVQRPFSDPTGLSRPRTALAPNPISHPTPITPIRKTLDGKLMGQPFDPLKWLEPSAPASPTNEGPPTAPIRRFVHSVLR